MARPFEDGCFGHRTTSIIARTSTQKSCIRFVTPSKTLTISCRHWSIRFRWANRLSSRDSCHSWNRCRDEAAYESIAGRNLSTVKAVSLCHHTWSNNWHPDGWLNNLLMRKRGWRSVPLNNFCSIFGNFWPGASFRWNGKSGLRQERYNINYFFYTMANSNEEKDWVKVLYEVILKILTLGFYHVEKYKKK